MLKSAQFQLLVLLASSEFDTEVSAVPNIRGFGQGALT